MHDNSHLVPIQMDQNSKNYADRPHFISTASTDPKSPSPGSSRPLLPIPLICSPSHRHTVTPSHRNNFPLPIPLNLRHGPRRVTPPAPPAPLPAPVTPPPPVSPLRPPRPAVARLHPRLRDEWSYLGSCWRRRSYDRAIWHAIWRPAPTCFGAAERPASRFCCF